MDSIVLIKGNHARPMTFDLVRLQQRKRHDDHAIAHGSDACHRSIQLDLARSALARQHICLRALAGGGVAHQNRLVSVQTDGVHQVGIDRQATVIVQFTAPSPSPGAACF